MDRREEDWYASDNNLRGTPRGSRKKPKAGRQPTGRLSTAVLRRDLEKNGMVRAWHEHGMACVNQTRPHCVNQMGKTHSKLLAARHGWGTAWARHGHGMLCVNRWSASLLSRFIPLQQQRLRYPFSSGLDGSQSRSGSFRGQKCHVPGNGSLFVRPVA